MIWEILDFVWVHLLLLGFSSPSLDILTVEIGKILGWKSGKICTKTVKRILSTSLSNILDTLNLINTTSDIETTSFLTAKFEPRLLIGKAVVNKQPNSLFEFPSMEINLFIRRVRFIEYPLFNPSFNTGVIEFHSLLNALYYCLVPK